MDDARKYLLTLIEERQTNLAAVSRAIGRNHAYLHQFINRNNPHNLPEEVREALAEVFRVPPDNFRGTAKAASAKKPATHHIPQANVDISSTQIAQIGGCDLPVYASAAGGDGAMLISYEPIEYVKRPGPLMNVPKGFAMYVVGDSMLPAYRPGDMLLIHPSKPPFAGDDILVVTNKVDGHYEAMVKQLISVSDSTLKLHQHNPPKDFSIPRNIITNIFLIVGNYRGRK